jgi:hypothetical protein
MLQVDSIDDIRRVFETGNAFEIRAVLVAKALRWIWTTRDGLRALALLHERNPRMFRRPAQTVTHAIYEGSDAAATRGLFKDLKSCGPDGLLAIELFRACKASERAKVYRGKGYRDKSYERKQQAMDVLCKVLSGSTYEWGWGIDDKQPVHYHVLYVDIPTGQVSFHSGTRSEGPDYPKLWDGQPGQSADRICQWIDGMFVYED